MCSEKFYRKININVYFYITNAIDFYYAKSTNFWGTLSLGSPLDSLAGLCPWTPLETSDPQVPCVWNRKTIYRARVGWSGFARGERKRRTTPGGNREGGAVKRR